eukprot:Gb_20749 [translate_table: standard]
MHRPGMNKVKHLPSSIVFEAAGHYNNRHIFILRSFRVKLWKHMKLFTRHIGSVFSMSTMSIGFKPTRREICNWEHIGDGEFLGTYEDFIMFCKEGRLKEAFSILYNMDESVIWADSNTYSALLQGCINSKALVEGKRVHAHMIKNALGSGIFLQNNLINMYAKCGRATDARQVFGKMSERNLVSWTTMITGYAQCGYDEQALKLFCQMLSTGMKPNEFTFGIILRACAGLAALHQGKQVHACITKSGFKSDVFAASALLDMYAKCGEMEDAREIFEEMPERNVVSWNAMIAGYVQNGDGEEALKLFSQMQLAGMRANHFTFASVLKVCASLTIQEQGKQVQAHVIKCRFDSDVFVGSALVDMYAKCGSIEDASTVFHELPKRDVVLWSGMIAGYAQHGHAEEALKLFYQMQWLNLRLDQFTFASVLSACVVLEVLEQGTQVHTHVVKKGFEADVYVGTALVDMYAKFGSMENARNVFDEISEQNAASWNAMIAGYVQDERCKEALEFLCQMQRAGMKPNQFTFSNSLRACASIADLGHGNCVHAQIIKFSLESDVFVGSALVDMYAKCGSIVDACIVFDKMPTHDAVSWTAMIAGYAQFEDGEEALKLFFQMPSVGLKPNQFTFAIVLNTSASLAALEQGKRIHAYIMKSGFESDVFVGSALVDMYAKSGDIRDAQKVFHKISERDMVSWSAMIAGYAQQGLSEEALKLFCQMLRAAMKVDQFTFASVLMACASLAALEQGKAVHAHIIKTGFGLDVFVGSALVDMYSKCGSIDDSRDVFDGMTERNLVSWTAMISGYAQHGRGKEAIQLFEQMQPAGIKPDSVTFVGVLSACSHVGLVNEGRHYFDSISQNHGMTPKLEHYACMVDLLGRAGCLDEAEDIINKMPFEPGALVWRTLLGACRIHGNMDLGKRAAEWVLELEPQDPASYVLLSNIYAAAARWDDVTKVRNTMYERGVRKEPGCSWIELKSRWHAFVIGDTSHPEAEMIYAELDRLTAQMKMAGYIPNRNFVMHDVDQE